MPLSWYSFLAAHYIWFSTFCWTFLDGLFNSLSWDTFKSECQRRTDGKIARLTESLDIVESYEIQTGEIKSSITLKGMSDGEKALLSEYIRNKVILVCTPLPEDTDVAAYFEIMNNRGEQLQAHEVIKALLMSDLGTSQRYIFQQYGTPVPKWTYQSKDSLQIEK